ncbi:hypothetical protein NHX12_010292 [Muraenolepis orangiensis]|uniref:Uncharacterized protein n=1 Tax=Muraenolepis orangiensis TaxID=630683 RepID=A0A9Q0DJH6_9TELE|nr:hypothetical protein NHX12_010292 [Muraenolepis orangiensis]
MGGAAARLISPPWVAGRQGGRLLPGTQSPVQRGAQPGPGPSLTPGPGPGLTAHPGPGPSPTPARIAKYS